MIREGTWLLGLCWTAVFLSSFTAYAQGLDGNHSTDAIKRVLGQAPPLSVVAESDEVPSGTIEVKVVDRRGDIVRDAPVVLGVMLTEGKREKRPAKTDENGVAVFRELKTGTTQAYRVNLPFQGAKYASQPFRLGEEKGTRVGMTQLPTTRSDKKVFQAVGQVEVQLRAGRIQVVQRSRIVNFGDHTYLFPKRGLLVELPEGAASFQTQETMGGQRLAASSGGFRIRGSLEPGATELTWGYELKYRGSEKAFTIPMPWNTFTFRVLSATSKDMRLEVGGMPAPEKRTVGRVERLVTELQRSPTDPPLNALEVKLLNIPGPGPFRWIALFAAVVLAFVGIFRRRLGTYAQSDEGSTLHDQKKSFVAELTALEKERESGAIGPKYYERERNRIRDELALLLLEEQTR